MVRESLHQAVASSGRAEPSRPPLPCRRGHAWLEATIVRASADAENVFGGNRRQRGDLTASNQISLATRGHSGTRVAERRAEHRLVDALFPTHWGHQRKITSQATSPYSGIDRRPAGEQNSHGIAQALEPQSRSKYSASPVMGYKPESHRRSGRQKP